MKSNQFEIDVDAVVSAFVAGGKESAAKAYADIATARGLKLWESLRFSDECMKAISGLSVVKEESK